MKRRFTTLTALLIAMLLVVALLAACAQEAPAPTEPEPEAPTTEAPPEDTAPPADGNFANVTTQTPVDPIGAEPTRANTLIVGYQVAAVGDFIPGFSIGIYDQTIWYLLRNHSGTVQLRDAAGEIYINPTIVADYTVEDDAAGNRTYTFELNRDLRWSDGTALTAFDFVTSVLWRASPQWNVEAGAGWNADQFMELLGWEAYQSGETEYFEGVRMIDDFTFALTINAEELPFFYELNIVATYPDPAHVWMPGVNIITNENGSRFSESIQDQAHNVAANFRHAPTVTAGPYTFVSFENNIVTLQRNTAFSGDTQGRMPTIDFIQQIEVSDETDVDQLFAGEVDILPDELEAAKIERVLANPDFSTHEYLRFGYGVVNFQFYGDTLPSTDVNVRWALAHLMDRQAVLDAVLGGRGSLIDTEASPGQWMWQARGAEAISAMRPIALSIESANYFLDQTEWIFEADGTTPFDPEQANAQGTYLRHNAAGEPLIWRNGAANPAVGDAIEIETVSNAAMAGMQFTSEFVDWVTVVEPNMNSPWDLSEDELIFSSFSMGWGFTAVFDPFQNYHSRWNGTAQNPAFSDAVLDDAMERIRNSDPDDFNGFLDAWFDYVVRFNEVLPALPLYNNMWMDLYNPRVQGMEVISDLANWAHSITQLSLT